VLAALHLQSYLVDVHSPMVVHIQIRQILDRCVTVGVHDFMQQLWSLITNLSFRRDGTGGRIWELGGTGTQAKEGAGR